MTSRGAWRVMLGFYLVLFFGFLFGPLAVMTVTAFNAPTYPQAYPFEAFTVHWFADLLDDAELTEGIVNSLFIGAGVVALAVPVGLAGAIVMTQIYWRARGLDSLIVVSPVLTPGVILGISTVIFWKDVTRITDAKFLYDGFFLAILGQSTFISAYCMLVFLARLQRFDRAQEEAALDLGATMPQVFPTSCCRSCARPCSRRLCSLSCPRSRTTTPRPSRSSPTRRWSRCWRGASVKGRRPPSRRSPS
ncbi:MAG: ABC transporter permease [Alphaproteobacteria bacterium]